MRTSVNPTLRTRAEVGMTLVELLVTTSILGLVLVIVTGILLTSSRTESRTVSRAEAQAASRQALALMTTELRQAGADPSSPPVGVVAIVSADSNSVRVRSDLNGDGAIQTAEPSEDVTYTFVDSTDCLTRNPGSGAQVVLTGVSAMRLTYYDENGAVLGPLPLSSGAAARVKSVGLDISTRRRDTTPLTLTTRVHLRNR